MARQGKKQAGFSIIEALITVLVVTVLAGGGWFVYQHNRTKVTNAAAGTGTQQTTKTTQPGPTVASLDIKEWGVHLVLDSVTSSLYYYIKPSLPDVAYLSLKAISDVAPNCAADKGSLAAIVRLTPEEQQTAPNADFSVKGTIQIGNYWYGYSKSHAACTDGTQAMNDAVANAAPNYSGGTLQNTFNSLTAD